MSLYLALLRKSFQRMLAYRTANLAGLFTNCFFGLLRAFLFIALFEAGGQNEVVGFTLKDSITFTGLTQAMLAPVWIFGWFEVMRTIMSGDIASDMTKPFDFYLFWLARDLGRALYHTLFRGVPIILIYALLFDLTWPPGPLAWLAFLVSLTMAVTISFAWRFAINCAAFWTTDARGIGRIIYFAVYLLSGFLIPVAFFPDWLARLARWTPFPAMINTPVEIYLGIVRGPQAWQALAVQLMWVVVLTTIARVLYAHGTRRLVIQGG